MDLSGSGRRRSNRLAKEQCKTKLLETVTKELSMSDKDFQSTNSMNDSLEDHMSPPHIPIPEPKPTMEALIISSPSLSLAHNPLEKPLSPIHNTEALEDRKKLKGTLKRRFEKLDKEIAEIKNNVQELMNQCRLTNKFGLKIMHASTTALCHL